MKGWRRGALLLAGLLALLIGPYGALAAPPSGLPQPAANAIPVCPGPASPGTARCHAILRTDIGGPHGTVGPQAVTPSGYGPADLQSAYNLAPAQSSFTVNTSGGKVVWSQQPAIAIVDAYDDPYAEKDLGVYRSNFGLPACTTQNGCFKKLNQSGGTRYPRANGGWAQEISLDLDMASSVCPYCRIVLVEASSNGFGNLMAAVDQAVKQGAVAISNSYGGSEFSGETTYDSHFNHPGIAITVSSGDAGYGVEYPAASRYVTAVGGTSLTRSSASRGWSETVWRDAGSGCSAYEAKPSWQTDAGCGKRTVADVAAVADPNTGVAVYDSYRYQGYSGWLVFGGTSVAAPVVAGVYALAGNSPTYGSYPYGHSASLNDVTSGSNGSCGGSYLCTGRTGYDGPTGNGTPNGTGGF
ncbi:MAG TPA: S8 family serine peptidase [Thermomicrobiaceae bacterium]|nr:S8 family serine peptidase [Thermomicrobiaceae bacterium]